MKADLVARLSDRAWRLSNLYKILDKDGRAVTYVPNSAQRYLYRQQHNRNVVLKARQMGFTTGITLFCLDQALFVPGTAVGIIAHKLDAAKDIFENKIKYAYDNLPDEIRGMVGAISDSAKALRFTNDSSIVVDTSLRSGTVNLLHVSEYGKICAENPERAREVRTGAMNTVQASPENMIWIESTAEGKAGHFWDLCSKNWDRDQSNLTLMDYKFHFFAWHEAAEYKMAERVAVPGDIEQYFEELAEKHSITLSDAQKAWYVKKAEEQGDDIKREFPSFKEEAFEQAVEGAYFQKQLAKLEREGRIGDVPYDPAYLVDTFWDIGHADKTAIWFFQNVRGEHRFIDYYERAEEEPVHYARILKERSYVYGTHHLPHDAGNEMFVGNVKAVLLGLGISPIKVGQRVHRKAQAIEAGRLKLPTVRIDRAKCSQGLDCLRNYKKKWKEKDQEWSDTPDHNWASHGADAFMEYAVNYKGPANRSPLKYRNDKVYA